MLVKLKIPKTILWVLDLFFIFLIIFTLFRFATYFAFKPAELSFPDLLPSFLLGLRYDLRWISLILLPIILLSLIPNFSPFYSVRNKKIWTWYLAIITFIVFFFFAADFGSFTYNNTRLDAGALNFVEDASISMSMLWQSYPLFWMLLGLLIVVLIFRWLFRRSHFQVFSKTDGKKIPYQRKWFIVASLLLALSVYGSISASPLSWKKAFVLRDNFKSYLALNPLQNFFTTLRLRKPQVNEANARKAFPVMADWMQLKNRSDFSFKREIYPQQTNQNFAPNVVLVLCESFSMYKSSMSGNPLNTTPYFNELSQNGIFFERCFTPHFSTARGLFATITGIPDVQLYKFSSRNPMALQHHTIINNMDGYDKYYFLGGSPGFNNFQGILGNVDGLQMITEGKFKSPPMNVWGISDKNLFMEAHDVFRQQQRPFFAIIQTADNHRPFVIPTEDVDFEKRNISKDSLKKYGFESVDEYNSFRYSDYCFKKFMESAKKEPYFNNTIFVFVGDHGVSGNATAVYPDVWTEQRLTDEHVPLLFYAPGIITPQTRKEVVSQVDVLPTIAGLIRKPYVNTTLGRDLLHPDKKNNFAFIINGQGQIGIVTDDYYYRRDLNHTGEEDPQHINEYLHPMKGNQLLYTPYEQDSIKRKMAEITNAFNETARWMLCNNKRN